MSKTKYKQCGMDRIVDGKVFHVVSYIPAKFGVVGRVLKLKDGDVWTDGWVVKTAGKTVDEPPDWRRAIRSHKKLTGDSLPKVKREH